MTKVTDRTHPFRTQHVGMSEKIIVVGVDASEPSKEALRWAARQAQLSGDALRVVMSWEIPSMAYWAPLPDGLDFEKETRQALHQTVLDVLGETPSVQVTEVVREGHPAPVLLAESANAELLVVGSRGHGEFTGMLIGSVSEHCVTHASCPVVVVRGATS